MKIGISWDCFGRSLGIDEQIYLLRKNGVEATFLMSDDPQLDQIMPKLAEVGIECESYHAPFKGINRMWSAGEDGEEMLRELTDGVDACARHGVPVLVVHLSSGDNAPTVNDIGLARYTRLMDYAKERGVMVAYENQRKLSNLAVAMELFPEAGFCWDVGHETCFTDGKMRFMPLFGDRIVALHLHDNCGTHNADEHKIPYDGAVDMDRAARQLAESGYSKAVMLELAVKNSHAYDEITAEEYYARAANAARRFAARLGAYRKNEA